MSLLQLCREICNNEQEMLPADHPLRSRIVRPEYSPDAKDTKTYPAAVSDQIFALCWNLDKAFPANGHSHGKYTLTGTIRPFPVSFSCRYFYQPGERTQTHTHEYLELAYVVSGEFRQRILGKDILFRQGDLCLIDRNCSHQDYLDEQPSCILFLGITNQVFERIINRLTGTEFIASFLKSALRNQKNLLQYLHFRPDSASSAQRMERYMEQLLQELLLHDNASSVICRGILIRIFSLLGCGYEFSFSRKLEREINELIYEEILDYIKEHMTDISTRKLSEHFHFQEDYFNRLLKARTGQTYTQYLQDLRLSEAARLLLETDCSIEQIAENAGYHNKGYFYKIFLQKYQMTPAQYRREH